MPVRRPCLFVIAALVAAPGAAAAKCPPAKTEAAHVAAGATVFTGRVRAVAPSAPTSRLPAYADLEVAGEPGRVLRVHAPDNGIYTASFELGRAYRVIAYPGPQGLSTGGCELRQLSP